MPRIPHSLLLHARNISPLLPILLRTCRTIDSTQNELRWLREHVLGLAKLKKINKIYVGPLLLHLCQQRGRGVPLQYLLGSQPFGELDILCRPNVLIPRPETEAYTFYLAKLLRQTSVFKEHTRLKVLDLCTGTGCIPLLLYGLLAPKFPDIELLGVDISKSAIRLANENLRHNIIHGQLPRKGLNQVSFLQADVLSLKFAEAEARIAHSEWDVVISNPPYISQRGFCKDTERSVRNWEPKLALVPQVGENSTMEDSHPEDIFYRRILGVAKAANSRVVLMEVGNMEQAIRVSRIAVDIGTWACVEVLKDWPDNSSDQLADNEEFLLREHRIAVKGSGNGRSVMCSGRET